MPRNYNIYVILTKTNLKIGKFIRKISNFEYSHVSISLSKDLSTMYSFSRKYLTATFCAGLTKESPLRYTTSKEPTKVKIFKIPVTKETYYQVKSYIEYAYAHEEEYVYNFISALAYPLRKKVYIDKSFTCCEFVVDILTRFLNMTELAPSGYASIKDLSDYLNGYLYYEGELKTNINSWQEDKYTETPHFIYKSTKEIEIFATLFYRFIKGLVIK